MPSKDAPSNTNMSSREVIRLIDVSRLSYRNGRATHHTHHPSTGRLNQPNFNDTDNIPAIRIRDGIGDRPSKRRRETNIAALLQEALDISMQFDIIVQNSMRHLVNESDEEEDDTISTTSTKTDHTNSKQ
jgi:hypothetical protein